MYNEGVWGHTTLNVGVASFTHGCIRRGVPRNWNRTECRPVSTGACFPGKNKNMPKEDEADWEHRTATKLTTGMSLMLMSNSMSSFHSSARKVQSLVLDCKGPCNVWHPKWREASTYSFVCLHPKFPRLHNLILQYGDRAISWDTAWNGNGHTWYSHSGSTMSLQRCQCGSVVNGEVETGCKGLPSTSIIQ